MSLGDVMADYVNYRCLDSNFHTSCYFINTMYFRTIDDTCSSDYVWPEALMHDTDVCLIFVYYVYFELLSFGDKVNYKYSHCLIINMFIR